MNPRELWARLRVWYAARAVREQRLLVGAVVVVGLGLLDLAVIEPIRQYRHRVQEEIEDGLSKLQHDLKRVARIEELKSRQNELRKRLDQVKQRLLPGDTGTLGAAALQDRANAIAADKGITVQSTQVMKEEVAEPFRKVSVRLTLSSEPKPLAEFLSAVEYTQQLTVPFLEVSRRGAVPGQKGPRTMQVSIEVAGFVAGKQAKGEKGEEEGTEAAPAAESGAENAAEPEKPATPDGAPAAAADAGAPPLGAAPAPIPEAPPSTVPPTTVIPSTVVPPTVIPTTVPAAPSTIPTPPPTIVPPGAGES